MSKRKLFAVDIDGTLCVAGQEIPSEVIESLRRCVELDVSVVFSTGKKFVSIQTLCENIGIDGPVITCNGAIVIEASTQRVLFSHFLFETMYRKIISALADDGRKDIAIFTDQDIACTSVNLASRLLSCINEPTTRFASSLLSLSSENVAKILIAFEGPETLRSVYDSYSHRYGQDCSIAITSERFLEFMSINASKGKALLRVAESIGIAREDIVCLGDSDNDLSMCEVAGLSVAVANASSSVLEAADVVVPSASECGVVKVIDDLILGGTSSSRC